MRTLILILAALIFTACGSGPAEIHYGHDECEYCRMIISEPNFASQLRTDKSMVYKFDSIECLAAFELQGQTVSSSQIAERWVPDFETRDWVDATQAHYLHSETLRSPMGLFLSAFETTDSADEHKRSYNGRILDYGQVQILVEEAWLQ